MGDTIRLELRGGFTVMPNRLVTDKRLSLKTKGLMAVLLSRPDGWRYSVAGLAVFCGVGRDAIRSALGELEAAGYLTRTQGHDEGGKFAGTEYLIRDHSVSQEESEPSPLSDFPTTVDPTTEKPTRPNKDISSKDIYTPLPPTGGAGPKYKPTWFDRFWARYPRKADKRKAIRAWDRLRPDRETCEAMAKALTLQMESHQWKKGAEYIPLPSTWLNGRRWEDEVPTEEPGGVLDDGGRLATW